MTLTYSGAHKRNIRLMGHPRNYDCVDCGNKASTWSQKLGTSGQNLIDYEPRCRPCHYQYDHSNKLSTDRRKLVADDVIEIRKMLASGHNQREVAEVFGVSKSLISHIHNRTAWWWI